MIRVAGSPAYSGRGRRGRGRLPSWGRRGHRHCLNDGSGPRTLVRVAAVTTPERPARPGQGCASPRVGRRWGLLGRRRGPADRAARVRSGGVRPDRVPPCRRLSPPVAAGRRRATRAGRDPERSGGSPGKSLGLRPGARPRTITAVSSRCWRSTWTRGSSSFTPGGRTPDRPNRHGYGYGYGSTRSRLGAPPVFGGTINHGAAGTGEPLAIQLRPGSAGSNTAVDQIEVTRQALRQLPGRRVGTRPGHQVLIRTDGAATGKRSRPS